MTLTLTNMPIQLTGSLEGILTIFAVVFLLQTAALLYVVHLFVTGKGLQRRQEEPQGQPIAMMFGRVRES